MYVLISSFLCQPRSIVSMYVYKIFYNYVQNFSALCILSQSRGCKDFLASSTPTMVAPSLIVNHTPPPPPPLTFKSNSPVLNMCSYTSFLAKPVCSALNKLRIIFPGKLKICFARKFWKYLTCFYSFQTS